YSKMGLQSWGQANAGFEEWSVKKVTSATAMPSGSISGKVFLDVNQNGLQEAGDAALAGAQVDLVSTGTNGVSAIVASTTTDSAGNYSFTELVAGTYTVLDSQPANY